MFVRSSVCARVGVAFLAAATICSPVAGAGGAADVFAKAAPSIVLVYALDEHARPFSQGSGVLVAPGYIATNCHVLGDATVAAVVEANTDKKPITAEIAGRESERDLCLLEIKSFSRPLESRAATIRGLRDLKVGAAVYAVGSPKGLELSLTSGIVSQFRRREGEETPVIQTDAAITFGSSGGGLFDENGDLVGVTTSGIKGGVGFNFAVPGEWVVEMLRARGVSSAESAGSPFAVPPELSWRRLTTDVKRLFAAARYDEALAAAKETLDFAEQSFGKSHPHTATSLNNLAAALYATGDLAAAEEPYLRALEIRQKSLGAAHIETADTARNLAALYHTQGRLQDAFSLYLRALESYGRDPERHRAILTKLLTDIAALQRAAGDEEKAREYEAQAAALAALAAN